ncbi:glycoside hydrolase family 31 protein [Streptococcus pluranimalium]|uniref:glycoside hydrolase family 31 protein n=1 Tax=Streptococcus pluranimalium TaxID=82348 RepID=UPI003F66EE3F
MKVIDNKIIGNQYRFTILNEQLVRMEYQNDGKFEDRLTTTVVNRNFEFTDFSVYENIPNFELVIDTEFFTLYYKGGTFTGDSLFVDSKYNFGTHFNRWHFGEDEDKNLKGTIRTLDKIDGDIDLENGIISKDGYAVLNDSDSMIIFDDEFIPREYECFDLYGFFHGRDYFKALNDFYKLSGYPPILPRYALGNWWSRYYDYSDHEYIELMDKFENENIPISVAVLDMNWHITDVPKQYGSGWTGYTWNKKSFPDPEDFLKELHQRGKKITLNLHPAAGIRGFEDAYNDMKKLNNIPSETSLPVQMNFNDKNFRTSYFNKVLKPIEDIGVDFWWIDWQQGGKRSKYEADPLWQQNYYHFKEQENNDSNNNLILSRYAGPGSHRYPVGFSGDTVVSWDSLAFQPYFNATASNIGYTWWSNDIGGHYKGKYDPELTLRWIQLGVFSPLLRLHSSDNEFIHKEPWNFEDRYRYPMTQALQYRHKILPYIETFNINNSTLGIPLIVPIYYYHSEDKNSFDAKNEFYFGSELIISPITEKINDQTQLACVKTYLPEGNWIDYQTGIKYKGNKWINNYRSLDQIPIFVKEGGIIVENPNFMNNVENIPDELVIKIYCGKDNKFILKEIINNSIIETSIIWDETTYKLSFESKNFEMPNIRKYLIHVYNSNGNNIKVEKNNLSFNYSVNYLEPISKLNKIYKIIGNYYLDYSLKKKMWNIVKNKSNKEATIEIMSLTEPKFYEPLIEILLGGSND